MRFNLPRITIADLEGGKPDWNDFVEEIAFFDRETLLHNLARIGILLRNDHFASFRVQNFLCQRFVSTELAAAINLVHKQRSGPIPIIFSPQAVLCLEKLVVRHGSEDGIRLERPEEYERVGRLVLTMNAFLDAEMDLGSSPESELRSMVIRQTFFNRKPRLDWAIARYWDLYVTLPSQFRTQCDIEKAYVEATGLNIEDTFAIGFGFISAWLKIEASNVDTQSIGIDPAEYFKESKIPSFKIDASLEQLVRDTSEHQAAIPSDVRTERKWEYHFRFAQEYPLVRLKSGLLVPLDLVFLLDKITSSIFYTIVNHFSNDRQFVNAFTATYGELFEEYVRRILKEIYQAALKHVAQGSVESGDALLFENGVLYVFEFKSTRVRLEARVTGDIGAYAVSLCRIFFKAAEQTHNVITRARKGDLDAAVSFEHQNVRRYQPVFVFEDALPQDPVTWRWYSSELVKRQLLQGSDVERPLLLCPEELEMLEPILKGAMKLEDLIDSKKSDSAYVDTSVHNFLLGTMLKDGEPENIRMNEKSDRAFDRIKEILFGSATRR